MDETTNELCEITTDGGSIDGTYLTVNSDGNWGVSTQESACPQSVPLSGMSEMCGAQGCHTSISMLEQNNVIPDRLAEGVRVLRAQGRARSLAASEGNIYQMVEAERPALRSMVCDPICDRPKRTEGSSNGKIINVGRVFNFQQ
jgi:hypothetical protein